MFSSSITSYKNVLLFLISVYNCKHNCIHVRVLILTMEYFRIICLYNKRQLSLNLKANSCPVSIILDIVGYETNVCMKNALHFFVRAPTAWIFVIWVYWKLAQKLQEKYLLYCPYIFKKVVILFLLIFI